MTETTATSPGRSWIVLHQPGRPPTTVDLTAELSIGRDVGLPTTPGHLATVGDPTVSRLHALLVPRAPGWSLQAADATNGVFVNEARVMAGVPHLLDDGDEIRLGERTWMTFHTLVDTASQRVETVRARAVPDLTPGERRVLVALCAPVLDGDAFTPPATVATVAAELFVTESAVKQQLGRLYLKFEIVGGPDRRVRLANEALLCGAVRPADLRAFRSSS